MLDPETTALNVTNQADAIGIFKPHALRQTDEPTLVSDADAEIIILARFTSPCHIRKIIVSGGGADEDGHPDVMKVYCNVDNIDFTNVEEFTPSQQFELPVNPTGDMELVTAPVRTFTNVTTIAFYFPSNHGGLDITSIKYIGMQGEHTHYKREAVDTTYEVLCNGQDIEQPEDQKGAHATSWH